MENSTTSNDVKETKTDAPVETSKAEVDLPLSDQTPTPEPLAVRLTDIWGQFPRVTSIPTWVPTRHYDEIAIDQTNNILYWYNFTAAAWEFTQGGATAAAIINALLPSQTSNSGKFLTTNGSAASWGYPYTMASSFTAGEAITAGNTVVVGDGTTFNHITQNTIDNTPDVNLSSNEMAGQTFTTPSTPCTLGSIRLYNITRIPSGSMDLYFNVYATSGGLPTGPSLGSSSTVSSHPGGDITLSFTTPVNLAANTVYAFVMISPQNYEVNTKDTTNPYSGGQAIFSSNLGSTWAAWAAGRDLEFDLNLSFFAGYIYQSSAATSNVRANNFIGIALETMAAFASGQVAIDGYVTGLSGLTVGRSFLSDTLGAIATSAGSQSRKIGIAATTTTFLIKHDNP